MSEDDDMTIPELLAMLRHLSGDTVTRVTVAEITPSRACVIWSAEKFGDPPPEKREAAKKRGTR